MNLYEICSTLGTYLHLKISSIYSRFIVWYSEIKKLH